MPNQARNGPARFLLGTVSLLLPPSVPGDTILMDLHTRTEFLYNKLRQSPFTMDVLEDAIAQPALGLELDMRNFDGDKYRCAMPGPGNEEDEGTTEGTTSSSAGPKSQPESTPAQVLRSLDGRCDVLSLGWWSYEWCHRKGIRQFHVDHSVGKIDPEWSLGEFVHSIDATAAREDATANDHESAHTKRARKETSAGASSPPAPIVDVFLNGQHCDETGQGRNTKVEFRCCGDQDGDDDGDGSSSSSSSAAKGGNTASRASKKKRSNARRAAVATLASIREPSTCSYEAVVCTPLLCEASRHHLNNGGVGGPGSGGNVSALELLEPLRGVCLARQEGWWGYEVCYGEQVRQFHVEAGVDAKGKATSRVAAEFVLGKAPNLEDLAPSETDARFIVPPSFDVDDFANAPSKLELEHEGGTPCDLLHAHKRSTTVVFACGAQNALTSVVEDRTCHYRATVTTPHLCAHPAFVHRRPPTRSITCHQQADDDDDREGDGNRGSDDNNGDRSGGDDDGH